MKVEKTTLYLDDLSKAALNQLPRGMSASKLFRWMAKAATVDNKTWKKLIKEDPEVREVQEFLRPRLRKALGLPDVEDKK